MAKKKTSGRKKIEIKKIEGTNNSRQVTFSKRRKGLFNKAGEICALTGAEILILAQSVGGRVHAFAHPNVDSIIDTYLGTNIVSKSENPTCMYDEYKKTYSEISEQIGAVKKKSKNVGKSDEFWWENSFEDLEIDELEIFIASMVELKDNVTKEADALRNSDTSSSFNEIANVDNTNGLPDEQVILPNLDLQNNVGLANEDLMMQPVNFDYSGFINNYNFGNVDFALDDHNNDGGNNLHNDGGDLQVQSDFGTFGEPNDLYFGQDYI